MKISFKNIITPFILPNSNLLQKINRLKYNIISGFALLILLSVPFSLTNGQERMKALTVNAELQNRPAANKASLLKSVQAQSIKLPFIDDFSSTTIFPDANFWVENNVFINSSFAVNPKTIGVASFDIFDAQGKIYTNAQSDAFGADTLTSNPIDLNYDKSKNIWLSFYIQPGGLGDEPDAKDSLKLEFYSPSSDKWTLVWISPGYSSSAFTFKCLPVNDTAYLKDGFRFRFINLASLSTSDIEGKTSIPDLWNLDYVKLDTGRNQNDSILLDIAFTKPIKSLLKNYNSMPWSHYLLAFIQEIDSKIDANLTNLNPDEYSTLLTYNIKELHTTDVVNFNTPLFQLTPWAYTTISADLSNPYKSKNQDSAIYEVRGFVSEYDKDLIYKWNDTAKFTQVFKNYFAYDDGTAESGYGISGQGAQNAMAAYSFYSYFPDTLRSVRIYFNPTQNNISESFYFKLAVWTNNMGKPGNMVYIDSRDRSPDVLSRNEFATFQLDSGILVNETFFIGWVQSSEEFLNIGYDLNNTNGQRFLYYNINGLWEQSGISGSVRPGSLMIRPVMRTEKLPVNTPIIKEKSGLAIYPIPARDYITVTSENLDNSDRISRMIFFNTLGQMVKTIDLPEGNIDISELKPGLYILKIQTRKGISETFKLLKEM